MKGISGKRVLVTGASRGIGEAIARSFIDAGAVVHILADDPAVTEVGATLGVPAYHVDITNEKAVSKALESIGALDVLINNAGLERLTPISDQSVEMLATFRRVIDININGTMIVTAFALPHMAEGGCIINTASIWGRVAEPMFGAYVASKHATIALTKTWAKELGPQGIRVNAVCPGWVRTVASIRSARSIGVFTGRSETAIIEDVMAAQALKGGLMEPDDITGPYLFLASDHATNITGQAIGIDRGEVPW